MTAWNKYHENLIKKWSVMAKTYSIMHSISSEYYNNLDKRLGIPVILLGAASASSIFTTSSESNNIWAYINGGMVLLMTGISGINRFLGTNEKLTKHTAVAFKYTEISMNIDTLLSFPRSDREETPKDFINKIKVSILEVREHAPDLPTWVISSYINKLDKSLVNTNTKINRSNELDNYDGLKQLNSWNSTDSPQKDPETHQNTPTTPTRNEYNIEIPCVKEHVVLINQNIGEDLYRMGKNIKQLEKLSSKLEIHNNSDTENEHIETN